MIEFLLGLVTASLLATILSLKLRNGHIHPPAPIQEQTNKNRFVYCVTSSNKFSSNPLGDVITKLKQNPDNYQEFGLSRVELPWETRKLIICVRDVANLNPEALEDLVNDLYSWLRSDASILVSSLNIEIVEIK